VSDDSDSQETTDPIAGPETPDEAAPLDSQPPDPSADSASESAAPTSAQAQPDPAASPSPEQLAKAAAEDEERRRAYRLNKVLGATLTSLSGDTQAARLFVIDISRSGFRATDHQPHSEEQYDISVVLSKDIAPFNSRMRVVWTKELTVSGMFQMGCEFVDTPEEELAKLDAFIDKERKKVEPTKAPVDLGRPWTMIR
jgi:hypothetical protein